MRAMVCTLLLAASLGCSAQPPAGNASSKSVEIKISTAGWAATTGEHSYIEGKPIGIRCAIRNRSRSPVAVDLKDHDAYHGTLSYPLEIDVRVLDANGKVLTANEIDLSGQGWWSWYYLWSTSFEPRMPGDTITIPPGAEVIRIVPIDQVLGMCPGLKTGLRRGDYTVQIRVDEYLSNALQIKVAPPKEA